MMRNSNGMGRGLLIAALLVVGLAVAAPSYAISYNLDTDHCSFPGCGPGGTVFGTVNVVQNGTTADVTVHLNSPYLFAKTGSVDFQAFKFNGTDIVVGDITVDAHIPGLVAATGAFNGDGTGAFSFGINCPDPTCGNGISDAFANDIVFHVANATIADLTATNNLGNIFVADIGNPPGVQTFGGLTGPVAATGPNNNVPEPASFLLLGAALAGIVIWRRKAAR